MSYTPKPGSRPARAIEELAEGPMSRELMAAFLGVNKASVDAFLASAIKAGAIVRTKTDDGTACFALPARVGGFLEVPAFTSRPEDPGAPEPPEPEAIGHPGVEMCMWADGELDIFGGAPIEQNGVAGVRLTRDHAVELVRLLTGCSVL